VHPEKPAIRLFFRSLSIEIMMEGCLVKRKRKASEILDEFDLKMIKEALKLDRKRRRDYIV